MTDRVLCTIDLSHPQAEALVLRKAAELATFYGATLSVMTVIPDYGMTIVGSFFEAGTLKKAANTANDQLHAFVARTLPDADHVQHIVEIGSNVYESVLDAAEKINADLIVLGASRPDLATRIQGPNSSRVVRYAKASVLVVRT